MKEWTVVERIQALGYETNNQLDWAAGTAIANRWRKVYAERMFKEVPKTNPTPTVPAKHLHRAYPDWFTPIMDEVIHEFDPRNRRQYELFIDVQTTRS